MNSMVGVCQQQKNNAGGGASLTISSITIITESYGTTTDAGLNPIDPSQQITSVLNSGNSFTVPPDGLAQYYSNNDVTQQVFHSMLIQYTATGFTIDDMGRQAVYETTLNQTPPNSQLNTWITAVDGDPSEQGRFAGGNTSDGVIITTEESELTPSDFFETSPTIGTQTVPLPLKGFPNGFVVKTTKGNNPLAVERLNFCPFAAQNLGTSSSLDIKLKILLKDGSYAEGTQTITVPVGAVKSNIVPLETFTLQSITITPRNSIPPESIGPSVPIDPSFIVPVVLDSGNSFTIPSESLYAKDTNNIEPGLGEFNVANSFAVTFDTSTLDPANYPEFSIIARIVVTEIEHPESFTWYQEGGVESQTFEWETEDRSQIITGGIVSPQIDYPDDTDQPFIVGLDLNGSTNTTVKVQIQNSVGVFVESNEVTLTIGGDSITLM